MLLSVEARSEDCLRSLRGVDLSGRLEAEGIVGFAVLTGLFLSSLVTKVMLRVLGEVVVAEMWPPIEMRELGEVVMTELWSPIEMRELGEVVMWSPIEMRELGEVAN